MQRPHQYMNSSKLIKITLPQKRSQLKISSFSGQETIKLFIILKKRQIAMKNKKKI